MKTASAYNIMCQPESQADSRLLLQDVRPERNRYRSYEIRIGQVETGRGRFYSLILSWGRVGRRKVSKTHLLQNEEELAKILKPILRIRYRHGYHIVSRSKGFPEFEILANFKKGSPLPSLQFGLFQ